MPLPHRSGFRRRVRLAPFVALWALSAVSSAHADSTAETRSLVERELPSLLGYYQRLHAAPELSHHEEHTAAQLATELRAAGFEVTEHIGKYPVSNLKGYGVAALLRNGSGPSLLIRADMDALPVAELTGLAYASSRRAPNDAGTEMPVMHACGHDIHVSTLVGVARVLGKLKDRWHGTLLLIGQPAEETIDGALAMLDDGLYQRFARPDYALALHDTSDLPVGTIGVTAGYAFAASTQVDVLVRGVGGHGARPENAKDPVVLAAAIVMQLQTIVSREISPFDQAVVTVGTIHGGTRRNIIPEEVRLELNLRSYKEEVRQHLIEAVARIARATALGAGMPEDRLPLVQLLEHEYAPPLYDDPALVARLRPALEVALGADNVRNFAPVMGSEDFGRFGLDRQLPVMMFTVGASSAESLAEAARTGTQVPGWHSPRFAPVAEPTLRTGIIAMSAAALELLKR